MSTSYGLIIEFSRNEKLQKYRIILSQHTNYLHKWLVHFLTCLLVLCLLFLLWDSEICASQERARPSRFTLYGSGIASLLSWLEIVNAGWLGSLRSEIFLQMKFIIFQGCPIKQAAFLPGQPVPYNQLLIQTLLLVPECYFA